MSRAKLSLHIILPLGVLLFSMTLLVDFTAAQQDKQEKLTALKQSLAQNQANLKMYTWTETTQVSLKGEVKKQEQKACRYGPDGKVQKTPIQGATPAQQQQPQQEDRQRGGRVKKAIVEKKTGELKDYMERVTALVHEYVPPDLQKIQAAQSAGNGSVEPPSVPGVSTLVVKNYEKPEDSVSVGFDSQAKKVQSYSVNSYLDKPNVDPVNLAVTFASLPDGTNYPQQSILKAPAKQIEVKITNSGYAKSAGP